MITSTEHDVDAEPLSQRQANGHRIAECLSTVPQPSADLMADVFGDVTEATEAAFHSALKWLRKIHGDFTIVSETSGGGRQGNMRFYSINPHYWPQFKAYMAKAGAA